MSALKNAGDTGKSEVIIEPASKLLGAMLRIMQDAGYIAGFEFIEDGRGGQLKVHLTGKINKCGAICPRFSVQLDEMEFWEKQYLPGKNFGLNASAVTVSVGGKPAKIQSVEHKRLVAAIPDGLAEGLCRVELAVSAQSTECNIGEPTSFSFD